MPRTALFPISLVAAVVACAPTPPPASPAEPQAPAVESPASESPAAAVLQPEHVEAAMEYSASAEGHAVLILHEGEELAGVFHNEWSPQEPHALASGTKSFWGPLVVAAIDDGILSGFDEQAADTLTEWKDDPRKSQITVRQLLAFTSGLAPDLGVTVETVAESDMFALSVAAETEADPGAKWAYSDSGHSAVGALLERKLAARDTTLEAYLSERLLAPLGIEVGDWQRDGANHLLMPSGARLTPQQWGAYGELIRRGGVGPDGTRVISEALLAECFEPSSAPPAGSFYGLGWWLTSYSTYKYELPRMVVAGGTGGQMLIVMPEVGLTIVRFGTGDTFNDGEFLCRLFHGTDTTSCPEVSSAH